MKIRIELEIHPTKKEDGIMLKKEDEMPFIFTRLVKQANFKIII